MAYLNRDDIKRVIFDTTNFLETVELTPDNTKYLLGMLIGKFYTLKELLKED